MSKGNCGVLLRSLNHNPQENSKPKNTCTFLLRLGNKGGRIFCIISRFAARDWLTEGA
jgi:hypothetical protein